ncbi:unnamed protein product [Danaus chrysippus]|uniref:E3 ubiquitin-protein ligase PPP1R11 n=1 Tax=Danaus chrysippus TaxID=151541 RepID=A0A8J2VVP0_9NEOP|nr:unnamed protein product [Danaus chrysippus]
MSLCAFADSEAVERVAVITLKPSRAANAKKVVWTEDTVDNEHMNKKKSKCCCIYEKPRRWDESDSESDDECEHCFGHVERRRRHQHATTGDTTDTTTTTTTTEEKNNSEKTATITLKPEPEPAPAPPDKTPGEINK